jgi:hypothetical protein
MVIDLSINIGHIIAIIGSLVTLIVWGNSIKWRIAAIEQRLGTLDVELKKISQLLITTTKLELRLSNLEDRVRLLECPTDRRNLSREVFE